MGQSHMKNIWYAQKYSANKKHSILKCTKVSLQKQQVIFNIYQLKDRIKNYIVYRLVTDTGWKYKYLRNIALSSSASDSYLMSL